MNCILIVPFGCGPQSLTFSPQHSPSEKGNNSPSEEGNNSSPLWGKDESSGGMLTAVSLALAQSQAELAATLARGISDRGESYFNCAAAPSVQALCPTLPANLAKQDKLDLAVPPDARWIFEGPSWQREIYLAFVVANGGCSGGGGGGGANRKELYGHTPSAALMPPGEKESSSAPCILPNGAVLAYADGQSEPGWIRSQTWTHGFYMQPHNEEYWQEHERAGQENRAPVYDAFADADGRDMCVPLEYGKVAWPKAGAFDEYLACRSSKPFWPAFKEIMRLHDTPLTMVVPWAIPAPEKSDARHNTSALWKQIDFRSPYFTRNRAMSIDCRARHVESADQNGAKPGFLAADTSIAEENMADPDKPSQALDHQCVTVCEGDGDSSSCFPGSIVWMAHDIREMAEIAAQWSGVMNNSRKHAQEEARKEAVSEALEETRSRKEARKEARKERRRHKR